MKSLGKARYERVALAFAVILAHQGSVARSRRGNLERPGPEIPAISGTGCSSRGRGLIQLNWIVLKSLVDFFQDLGSQFFGCFGGSQSFFELPFF